MGYLLLQTSTMLVSLLIFFNLYEDEKSMTSTTFPNVEHRLSKIQINNKPAILAEEQEGEQFTVVYTIDTLLITIFMQDISKEEVNQIINSMK